MVLASIDSSKTFTLTRDARAFLVTIMIGHTGRYFAIKRAVLPLTLVSSSHMQMVVIYTS